MKTVILCGGKGTRLREETEFKPKPLVDIGGKPILWHIMKIYSVFNQKHFVLALGYKGEMIKEYFLQCDWRSNDFHLFLKNRQIAFYNSDCRDDWEIDFADTGQESSTALRLYKLKSYLQGEDNFMLTYGDGVANIDIDKLIKFHREKGRIATIIGLHPRSKYGVVKTDGNGLVKEFREKPILGDFINGGFMVFNKRVFDYLDERNIMLEEFLVELSAKGEVALYHHEGFWHCMDTYADYLDLNKMWEKNPEWKIWKQQKKPFIRTLMLEEFYKNKKILITGHTGFKGSWLSQILINWGAQVVGYSLEPNTQPALFDILGLAKRLEHHIGDIRDYQNLKKIITQTKPEIVFHLAAQPLVRESYDNPLYTFQTNIMGTANLLQAVKEGEGVKAVVVITTDKVYRNQEQDHCFKEDDPLSGYDPYSASKAGAEIVTDAYLKSFFNPQDYNVRHQTLIASARSGNVIGGGDWSKDRLMTDIIRAVFENDKPVIIRNPQAVRPWQHVLEPLGGYLLLAEKLYQGQREFVGPWNFGPDRESFLTVEEILSKAFAILQKGAYAVERDDKKHETTLLKLDINKAKNVLKWRPIFDIDTALNLTFNWYKSFYNKENIVDLTNQQINSFLESLNY